MSLRIPVRLAFLLALAWMTLEAGAADAKPSLPPGYKLLYQQKFDAASNLRDFIVPDPVAWKWTKEEKGGSLELFQQNKYEPAVRSPVNIALIKDRVFTDFILEADLLQTSKDYGHRDMCLFFGFTDPAKFYYTHLATAADEHAHNIFIVNRQPRVKIARETTKGLDWGRDVWHKVRLERRASEGTIKVYFDDLTKPIMIAEDKTFPSGYVGFGSFDDTGKVTNVKIWGPSVERKTATFFQPAAK
ncbi:MAG TPA: hypothetical protein VHH73_15800 [Verrucomicrobiae bacterium]|nr:hypothetical protein [Verrucomicrobiae bacterium]